MKKKPQGMTYKELVESTRGLWKKGDGLAYQESLRPEWELRLQDCILISEKQ